MAKKISRKRTNAGRVRARGVPAYTGVTFSWIVVAASFLFSVIFFGATITGNAVGDLDSVGMNIVGAAFFLIAIVGALSLLKRRQ